MVTYICPASSYGRSASRGGQPPLASHFRLGVPGGSAAKSIVLIQHWHTLGLLSASFTPRPCYPYKGRRRAVGGPARPPGPCPVRTCCYLRPCTSRGGWVGRVRMGHVLFADCGQVKVMCKEQRLANSFHVLVNELRVGDTLCPRKKQGF